MPEDLMPENLKSQDNHTSIKRMSQIDAKKHRHRSKTKSMDENEIEDMLKKRDIEVDQSKSLIETSDINSSDVPCQFFDRNAFLKAVRMTDMLSSNQTNPKTSPSKKSQNTTASAVIAPKFIT